MQRCASAPQLARCFLHRLQPQTVADRAGRISMSYGTRTADRTMQECLTGRAVTLSHARSSGQGRFGEWSVLIGASCQSVVDNDAITTLALRSIQSAIGTCNGCFKIGIDGLEACKSDAGRNVQHTLSGWNLDGC